MEEAAVLKILLEIHGGSLPKFNQQNNFIKFLQLLKAYNLQRIAGNVCCHNNYFSIQSMLAIQEHFHLIHYNLSMHPLSYFFQPATQEDTESLCFSIVADYDTYRMQTASVR